MRVFLAATLALVLGCTTLPKERELTDEEIAPQDVDANAPLPVFGPQEKAPETPRANAPASSAPGPILTIIDVTDIKLNERKRPGALIFSSDEDSPYLQERPRPSRVILPLIPGKGQERRRMAKLLEDLKAAGLDSLPRVERKPDDQITGERQFIFLRDGKRVDYPRRLAQNDAQLFKAWCQCEKVLMDCAHEWKPFLETQGGKEPGPESFKPLNPDR